MNEYNTIKSKENYNKKIHFRNNNNLRSSIKIFNGKYLKSGNTDVKEKKLRQIKIKIKSFNLPYSVLITFIYLLFGHFFIPINIYLIESNLRKSYLILTSIILIIIPFFFIQILFNIILLIFYIKMVGYKIFLYEFYYNIKMKKSLYKISLITFNAYHVLVVLFLGTFMKIINALKDFSYRYNLGMYILGIISGLIILPLHIIINPFLLFYAIKKNKNNIKILKEYIYNI